MSGRPQFDAAYIQAEFETIGTHLDEPVTAYLIGGGAMSLRGLKDATKDIDIVVSSAAAHDALWTACAAAAYKPVQSLDETYRALGAKTVCDNEDGCRIEIFDRQVVNTLVLSEGMKARSEPFLDVAALTVRLVGSSDIFLFKAVAKRATDIDDMNVLVQTGLDFEAVLAELHAQVDLLGDLQFVTDVGESLGLLADRHGVTLPIEDDVEELSARYYDALEVRLALDEPVPVDAMQEELGISRDDLMGRIDVLERMDEVVVEDGVLHPVR